MNNEPKPCHHKRANHQHGQYATYVHDKCRCYKCAYARSLKWKEWEAAEAAGHPERVTPAVARTHLIWLHTRGVGLRAVSKASGVGRTALGEIRRGDRTWIWAVTEAKIVAVDESAAAPKAIVECWPARRRLQALMARGWSMPKLVAELDGPVGQRQAFDIILNGKAATCTAQTLNDVAALYDRVWDKNPPEAEWRDRISVSRSKGRAFREGWAPPMAWDDIDEPWECPNVGTVEKGVDLEEVDWLIAQGETFENACRRLHTTTAAVEKARSRQQQKGESDGRGTSEEAGGAAACA